MKYSPDVYFLHESNRFTTFNIRIKVMMKEPVDSVVLKAAAERAFTGFPYYSRQILIDEEGGIDLIPNPRTICVSPVSNKRTYLFSKEVNYQPCSIEYEDHCIYFNMYRGLCGGRGALPWVKTTIYEYICARYGVRPDPGSTIMVDDPIFEAEYAFPKREDIPEDQSLCSCEKADVWVPGAEYLLGIGNLLFGDSVHYEFEIPKKELMRYVGANDGSPLSVIAAIMVKALYRALPKNKMPIRLGVNYNHRDDTGSSKIRWELLTYIFCVLPSHTRDWPIDKISTVIEDTVFSQGQQKYGYDALRRFYAFMDRVDRAKGLKYKKKSASKIVHCTPDTPNSFLINYEGRENWGGMTEYVEGAFAITDAHLLLEILDVGDNFCISLMQMIRTKKYMDSFCRILDEEKISYKIHGVFKNHLPVSKVESAPVVGATER